MWDGRWKTLLWQILRINMGTVVEWEGTLFTFVKIQEGLGRSCLVEQVVAPIITPRL